MKIDARTYLAGQAPPVPYPWFQPQFVVPEPTAPVPPKFDAASVFPEFSGGAPRFILDAIREARQRSDGASTVVDEMLPVIAMSYLEARKGVDDREISDDQIDALRLWANRHDAYMEDVHEHQRARRVWIALKEKARIAQWPWVWADLVLSAQCLGTEHAR